MDHRIKAWGQIPDYNPEDISQALAGYGPPEFQAELQAFIQRYGQHLTGAAICRMLGIDYQHLPPGPYGQYATQAVVVLRPQADLQADTLKFQGGVI